MSKHGRHRRGRDRDDRIAEVVVAAQADHEVEATTSATATTQTEEHH
jgi:hypothetical protein